jgi:hypothetical protein
MGLMSSASNWNPTNLPNHSPRHERNLVLMRFQTRRAASNRGRTCRRRRHRHLCRRRPSESLPACSMCRKHQPARGAPLLRDRTPLFGGCGRLIGAWIFHAHCSRSESGSLATVATGTPAAGPPPPGQPRVRQLGSFLKSSGARPVRVSQQLLERRLGDAGEPA